MVEIFKSLRFLHIIAGAITILLFFIPLIARKGGRLHVRVGWVYASAMAFIVISAFTLSGIVFPDPLYIRKFAPVITEARRLHPVTPAEIAYYELSQKVGAVFTAYLAAVTLASLWHGISAVRTKRNPAAMRNPLNIGWNILAIAWGVVLLVLGIRYHSPVLLGVSPLGAVVGIPNLRYILRGPQTRMGWWYEHLSGMIGSGIAAWTAFVVIGGGVFFRDLTRSKGVVVFWIMPSILGYPAIQMVKKYYRRKFHEDKPAPAVPSRVPEGAALESRPAAGD
jgi:hypothetical protein